jgi:hypothetical protein
LRSLRVRSEEDLAKERAKCEAKIEETQRRHASEVKLEKERIKIESEEWKAEFLRRQAENMQEVQRRLREESVRERNKEIAAIIERLGEETHDTQKQMVASSEKRIREVELKWKSDVEEYRALITQWKDKFNHESESRKMLDDNLRVLGRRVNELELEGIDKQEKLAAAERFRKEAEDRLSSVHDHQ